MNHTRLDDLGWLPVCAIATLLLFGAFSWSTQNLQRVHGKGRIIGRLLERKSGEPLIGGNVVLDSTYLGSSTDINGGFSIGSVPEGIHVLTATYIGYRKFTQRNITVKADSTIFVLILMDEQPVWSSAALHEALESEALHDADSLWEIEDPRLLSSYPITTSEKWFADKYRFRFVYDTTNPWIYRRTFNGRINDLMEDRFGAIYTNQLHALWERNHYIR